MIDKWIEDHLQQIREMIDGNSVKKLVDFSEVEKFEPPTVDLSTSFGVGLLTGIIGFIINPGGAILAGIIGFFGNFIISATERRAKRITEIMKGARKCYEEQFITINSAYMDMVTEHSKLIMDYAHNKIDLFFRDLQKQMEKLSSKISVEEETQYKEAFSKIKTIRTALKKLDKEINGWYAIV